MLSFCEEVEVKQEREKWFEVVAGGKTGWVSCYYLADSQPIKEKEQQLEKIVVDDGFPVFKIGAQNLASDENTKKLRKIINDEFGGGANSWALQCTEYVQYKIQRLGITIKWPNERPRHGGRWAMIFEGAGMYKVLSEPKQGCAMSFTAGLKNSNVGHVAYVEEVYQDGSIKISEANWPPPGKYFERILTKNEWQDKYKGKFINFI